MVLADIDVITGVDGKAVHRIQRPQCNRLVIHSYIMRRRVARVCELMLGSSAPRPRSHSAAVLQTNLTSIEAFDARSDRQLSTGDKATSQVEGLRDQRTCRIAKYIFRWEGAAVHFFDSIKSGRLIYPTWIRLGMSNQSLLSGWRQRWNRNLFQFLGRRVRARVDIEDIAQETYLRLLRSKDLGEVRNPQAYLLRVASHVMLEWRDQQPRSDSFEELQEYMLVDDASPEFELEASASQEQLDRTLASVSPMMRAVLLLRLRDERSHKDIAEELGITIRQVRRYLARGVERLRSAMES